MQGYTFQASKPPSARTKSTRSRKIVGTTTEINTDKMKSESEGVFWFEQSHTVIIDGKTTHKGISTRERQQLKEIVKSQLFTEKVIRDVVIQLNDENSDAPRLRAYDWAVTNYAKGNPKSMLIQYSGGSATIVDPNLSYEGELRRHHRLLFDPFRRGSHIFFEVDGIIHRTTVGQLTFIKWCLENGVDKYVEENLSLIRSHMSSATKKSRISKGQKKRRRELTRAPTNLVRGVLMTTFNIVTDTHAEIEAGKMANAKVLADDLARDIAKEDIVDIDKVKKLAKLL